MTNERAIGDVPRAPGRFAWPSVVPACLLACSVAVYLWMAPRGFEFTDESFYVLNYTAWRELTGLISFFGAYIEWPYRLLGQNLVAIRVFSLVLLLGCGAFFAREALRWRRSAAGPFAQDRGFVAAGTAASMLYFAPFSTLRAPSYNLLALCAMLTATGLLLRMLRARPGQRLALVPCFLYGLAIGACAFCKVTTGGLLVALHLVFFAVCNEDWNARRLAARLAAALSGVVLNVLAIQAAHPSWRQALATGIELAQATDSRYGIVHLANALRWDLQAQSWLVVPSALALGLLVHLFARRRPAVAAAFVVAATIGCGAALSWPSLRAAWLSTSVVAVLLLFLLEKAALSRAATWMPDRRAIAFTCLVFVLPVAFSFGTNDRVVEHSLAAGVFPVTAVLIRLRRLAERAVLGRIGLSLGLAAVGLAPLVAQVRPLLDADQAYRQQTALIDQDEAVRVGTPSTLLLVDPSTRLALEALIAAAAAAGLPSGQPVQDFTGDGSGLIYSIGARPLATAWTGGGYPGSEAATALLLDKVPKDRLRAAWLLSSEANPRAIQGWERLLASRIGPDTHERVVTLTLSYPYRWRREVAPRYDVQLWRPKPPASASP